MNIGEKKLAITDNAMIEEHFGEDDVLCVDDIVELFSKESGSLFHKVNAKLWSF